MKADAENKTSEWVRVQIKCLIADVTEREPEEISDTALFEEQLGVDSLLAMEIMVTMIKKFKIEIPEEEFKTLKNVDDAVAVVMRIIQESK